MNDAWQANIDAFGQTARSMVELGAGLGPADWERPTECPGWSVKDQYSHVLGFETYLLSEVSDGERRTVENTDVDVEAYRVEKVVKAERVFQKHNEVTLQVAAARAESRRMPAGTILVRTKQPVGWVSS